MIFSPSGEQISGVLTMSTVDPITQCSFVSTEPFLRTPKATNITQFGLEGREETLVVVNMHAVNFSFGLKSFRRQFDEVRQTLSRHEGPVILSGDLNTWRQGRLAVVTELAADLGLVEVRGLKPLGSTTLVVSTSDHNPMSATFAL